MLFVNSEGKQDLSKRITTDVGLNITLKFEDDFFIDNNKLYKEEDYVTEKKVVSIMCP
jgi:hypothetical protein